MKKLYESNIIGEFEGWNGDSTYELDNGTIWKLTSYKYVYTYSYKPKAFIYTTNGQYFLEVVGMNERVQVHQVN